MQNKIKVPVMTAQEFIKDIRLLALSGKKLFSKYLYEPLLEAGWRSDKSGLNRHKQIDRLNLDSANPAYLNTIAPRCKKIICMAMDESLAAVGDSSIIFFEKMQLHTVISSSIEAIEFSEILTLPLGEFSRSSINKNEDLFTEAMQAAPAEVLKTAFEPVKLSADSEKIRLDSEIRRLYENILIASQYHNIPKCRKLLSTYIIRYSDNEDYARSDVEKLVVAMNNRAPGFEEELKNTMAIDLYYRITQGVLKGDIHSTVSAIRKYGYIFEGDSTARYFFDIDRLERILYKMISEKGLWDELKNKKK